MDSIRAITEVTTVYREREISTSRTTFVGEYIIRFILPIGGVVENYYKHDLKPELKAIHGLGIDRDLGYEKIGDE